jgi:hypothetical protein
MTVFWDVAPSSLAEIDRHFRGACSLMMAAVSTSETSINFYETTRRNIPEDGHLQQWKGALQIRMHVILKSVSWNL